MRLLIKNVDEQGGEVSFSEMFATFSLAVGAAVGMEFWARWAHRALWHASLWHMHEVSFSAPFLFCLCQQYLSLT